MYFCTGGFNYYKWNLCSHTQMFIPDMEKLLCNVKNFTFIHCFYSSKTWGLNNKIYAVCNAHFLQFTNNQHLSMSHSLRYEFPCWILHYDHQFCMLCYFCNCFHILHCCTCCFLLLHIFMMSRIFCCVVSFIVMNSYKITLFSCLLCNCGWLYGAVLSIKIGAPLAINEKLQEGLNSSWLFYRVIYRRFAFDVLVLTFGIRVAKVASLTGEFSESTPLRIVEFHVFLHFICARTYSVYCDS